LSARFRESASPEASRRERRATEQIVGRLSLYSIDYRPIGVEDAVAVAKEKGAPTLYYIAFI
jgi:hypothetical protein